MQVGTGQGPYLRSLELLGKSSVTTKSKNKKKVKCDRPTNATTDGETSVTRDKKKEQKAVVVMRINLFITVFPVISAQGAFEIEMKYCHFQPAISAP